MAGADGHIDQPGDIDADDLPDATLDLKAGFVVPAAESVAYPLQCVFGLDQRALSRVCDLGGFLAGVDVGHPKWQRRPVRGCDLPVA